ADVLPVYDPSILRQLQYAFRTAEPVCYRVNVQAAATGQDRDSRFDHRIDAIVRIQPNRDLVSPASQPGTRLWEIDLRRTRGVRIANAESEQSGAWSSQSTNSVRSHRQGRVQLDSSGAILSAELDSGLSFGLGTLVENVVRQFPQTPSASWTGNRRVLAESLMTSFR
ncbi:MAG: hypothetical protein KDA85_04770, partial [Planctomycetaceae bacterium]|nr:hypothetical protein [Planctomycetaceae bacterium]